MSEYVIWALVGGALMVGSMIGAAGGFYAAMQTIERKKDRS